MEQREIDVDRLMMDIDALLTEIDAALGGATPQGDRTEKAPPPHEAGPEDACARLKIDGGDAGVTKTPAAREHQHGEGAGPIGMPSGAAPVAAGATPDAVARRAGEGTCARVFSQEIACAPPPPPIFFAAASSAGPATPVRPTAAAAPPADRGGDVSTPVYGVAPCPEGTSCPAHPSRSPSPGAGFTCAPKMGDEQFFRGSADGCRSADDGLPAPATSPARRAGYGEPVYARPPSTGSASRPLAAAASAPSPPVTADGADMRDGQTAGPRATPSAPTRDADEARWLAFPDHALAGVDAERVLAAAVAHVCAGLPGVPREPARLVDQVRAGGHDVIDWHNPQADRVLVTALERDWAGWSPGASATDMLELSARLARTRRSGVSVGALDSVLLARIGAVDAPLAAEIEQRADTVERALRPHLDDASVRQWIMLDRLAATLSRLAARCDAPTLRAAADAAWRGCRQQERESWSTFVASATALRRRAGLEQEASVAEWWTRTSDSVRKEVTRALVPIVDELVRVEPGGELAELRRRVDRDEAVLDVPTLLYTITLPTLHRVVTKAERRAAAFARHHPKG